MLPPALATLLSPLLAPLSAAYYAGSRLDRRIKEASSVDLQHPVISIGNLTTGGAGKTPLLMRAAKDLLGKNKKVVVLTRGYSGFMSEAAPSAVLSGSNNSHENLLSDEVRLMRAHVPGVTIGLGSNRVQVARRILENQKVDVFLLDDGFQHWKISRDLDIVCVDAMQPWRSAHMIPWGNLREPKTALRRAQLIVITRSDLIFPDDLEALKKSIHVASDGVELISSWFSPSLATIEGHPVDLKEINKKRVLAVSAVGNPFAFETSLRHLGGEVIPCRYRDHHHYQAQDVERIQEKALKDHAVVVCTEKDAVKFRPLALDMKSWRVLMIDTKFSKMDQERWDAALSKAITH